MAALVDSGEKMAAKRSILGLIPLITLMERHGQDPLPLLQKHNIALDNMMGNAVIEPEVELEIIGDILARLDKPLLGIEVGKQINFTSYGALAMLIMTSATLLEACRLSVQFQSLSLLYSHSTLHMEQDYLEIRLTLPRCKPEIKSFIADRDLMGSYVFISEILSDTDKALLSCGTCRPKPTGAQLKTYRQYIDFNPQFDQAYNWFRMPYSMIRHVLPHSNPLVHKIHLVQAYEAMRNLFPDHDDIVTQVKRIISGYDTHFPALPEIAKSLGKSERTLGRKLSEAGVSYREILDELKKKRALDMLALQDMSVGALTLALDYTEPASFLRAFKRWTGLTPKQYLKQRP